MKEFKLRYSISEKDFMEAFEAHWKSNKHSTRSTVVAGLIGAVAGAAYSQMSLGWGIALGALGLVLIAVAGLRRFLHVRAFRESKKYQAEIETIFGEEKIEVKSNDGESTLKWSLFTSVMETPRFVLLYLSPRAFSIIPKNSLGDQVDEFLELVEEKISS